ncbi:MAG: hypothetical protein DGJ47_000505 [Rickettsiaceae bacterium]
MANHSSTKKSIRKTVRVSEINKNRKSRIKTYVKKVLLAIQNSNASEAQTAFIEAQSEIMKGVSKNILKKNTASRKISKLSKAIKNIA